jgi:Na+-driven multidrug efflux pump
VISQYFLGIGRADISVKIAIVPLIIQVVTAILLIPMMGLAGAAIALLVTLLSLSLIQIFIFLRLSTCTLKMDLLIRKDDVHAVANFARSEIRKLASKLPFYKV